jgi:hypothetical protein
MRIYKRFAMAVGSLLALVLAGGAVWKPDRPGAALPVCFIG